MNVLVFFPLIFKSSIHLKYFIPDTEVFYPRHSTGEALNLELDRSSTQLCSLAVTLP